MHLLIFIIICSECYYIYITNEKIQTERGRYFCLQHLASHHCCCHRLQILIQIVVNGLFLQ